MTACCHQRIPEHLSRLSRMRMRPRNLSRSRLRCSQGGRSLNHSRASTPCWQGLRLIPNHTLTIRHSHQASNLFTRRVLPRRYSLRRVLIRIQRLLRLLGVPSTSKVNCRAAKALYRARNLQISFLAPLESLWSFKMITMNRLRMCQP